jgi:hypothetical protein
MHKGAQSIAACGRAGERDSCQIIAKEEIPVDGACRFHQAVGVDVREALRSSNEAARKCASQNSCHPRSARSGKQEQFGVAWKSFFPVEIVTIWRCLSGRGAMQFIP